MKKLIYMLVLGCCLLVAGACNETQLDMQNPDVELFVDMLKKGTYRQKDDKGMPVLPHFTAEDIPELLEQASDMTLIPSFPTVYTANTGKIRLGECLLWVVETVRLGYPASMGCHMVHADAENYEAVFFLSDEEVQEAVEHYRAWWDKRRSARFVWKADPGMQDPLYGSGFRWW